MAPGRPRGTLRAETAPDFAALSNDEKRAYLAGTAPDEPAPEPAMPTSVRVGPFTYRVSPMTSRSKEETGFIGWCNTNALEIAVWPDLHPQKKAEVLLHEICHAVFNAAALRGRPSLDEEQIVEGFGMGLIQVIGDNPEILAYLQAASRYAR